MNPIAVDTEIAADTALERHYSVPQVAEMWGWSDTKVREVFSDKPGVLQSQLRAPLRAHKRQKITLAIPLSIVRRVHRRLRIGGQAESQRGYGLVKGNLHGLHERRVMFFGGLDGRV